MVSLLAVILFSISPNICAEVEQELREYNKNGGNIKQEQIDRILGHCRVTYGNSES